MIMLTRQSDPLTNPRNERTELQQGARIRISRRSLLKATGTLTAGTVATFFTPESGQPVYAQSTSETQTTKLAEPHWDNAHWQRRMRTYRLRVDAAERYLQPPPVVHLTNGDEERYPTYIASFTKGLPHNDQGEVLPIAYTALLAALQGKGEYAAIPLGGDAKLANPQAAMAYQLEGMDSHDLVIPAPPAFDTVTVASELLELYWKALARDVHFAEYGHENITAAAFSDLLHFPYFANWDARRLFRGETAGDLIGPYLSQFLTLPIPYGATTIQQMYRVPVAGDDHMADYTEWLRCQNGILPQMGNRLDTQIRYLRNGRDLGEYVHQDFSYQAFLNAALLLNSFGKAALSNTNPYKTATNQGGFATFGGPDVLSLVAQVANLALKAAWAQKWLLHRRTRPEMFAGRFHQQQIGVASYPIHAQLAKAQGTQQIFKQWGNYLLPQAYPEGCPTHPAYPAGHATIAGACVTVLKAFYNEDYVIPNPQFADPNGLKLLPYKNSEALTIGNELNKLAANIALGRDFAGVHWRSDGIQGLALGEAVALALLQDVVLTYPEAESGFQLTRFDGTKIAIQGASKDV